MVNVCAVSVNCLKLLITRSLLMICGGPIDGERKTRTFLNVWLNLAFDFIFAESGGHLVISCPGIVVLGDI